MKSGAARGWTWFIAWSIPGASLALLISYVGYPLLPLGALATWWLFRRTGLRAEMLGALEGVAFVLLLVAVLNRDYRPCPPQGLTLGGQGTVSCGGTNPLPWLTAGLSIALVAVIGYVLMTRRNPTVDLPMRKRGHNGLTTHAK